MRAMARETKVEHQIGAKHWSRIGEAVASELEAAGVDAVIAAFLERQHDVVARWQLLQLGIGRGAIRARLQSRRLHLIHRGVYSPSRRARTQTAAFTAAALALGPDAVLARRSAAAHLGIRGGSATRVELIVPRTLPARDRIAPIHALLPGDEITIHHGIPVTSAPRTILDLASVLPRPAVEQAIERAEAGRVWDALSLRDLLKRYPRRRGTRALRAILADSLIGHGVTRERLEAEFRAFLAPLALPPPEINAPLSVGIDTFVGDFVWRKERVIVELDGFATHGTRRAFERDRRRDRRLQAAGWRTVRVTWRHLEIEGAELAEDLIRMIRPESCAA